MDQVRIGVIGAGGIESKENADAMLSVGALAVQMSGSGSTLYGIYENAAAADAAELELVPIATPEVAVGRGVQGARGQCLRDLRWLLLP